MKSSLYLSIALFAFACPNVWALSASQKLAIGHKIWRNECAEKVSGLTSWNAGENFPSLGIGHFIWYVKGQRGPFEESWPEFVHFAKKSGAAVPTIAQASGSPWPNRQAFTQAQQSTEMKSLRTWLSQQIALQADFIAQRSKNALPKILAAAPSSERQRIEANYHKVASSAQGTYALIDYVNFKGEGTVTSERYQGRGWGLLQVLGEMKDSSGGNASASEFAAAAKRVLARRVSLAPTARGEKRWLAGWLNRCDTYAKSL